MSELAAFIFWVVITDTDSEWSDPATQSLLHPNHIELNSFILFDALMRSKMIDNYRFEDRTTIKRNELPINRRSNNVFKRLMRAVDDELYKHLESMRFQPIITILKWVRLIFLREFEVHSCLLIWDFMFKHFSVKVEIYDFRNNRVLRDELNCVQNFDIFDFVTVSLYLAHKKSLLTAETEMEVVQVLQEITKASVWEIMVSAEDLIR